MSEDQGMCHLMRATNHVEVVFLQELFNHIKSKGIADSAIIVTPACDVSVWI